MLHRRVRYERKGEIYLSPVLSMYSLAVHAGHSLQPSYERLSPSTASVSVGCVASHWNTQRSTGSAQPLWKRGSEHEIFKPPSMTFACDGLAMSPGCRWCGCLAVFSRHGSSTHNNKEDNGCPLHSASRTPSAVPALTQKIGLAMPKTEKPGGCDPKC